MDIFCLLGLGFYAILVLQDVVGRLTMIFRGDHRAKAAASKHLLV